MAGGTSRKIMGKTPHQEVLPTPEEVFGGASSDPNYELQHSLCQNYIMLIYHIVIYIRS
ncbi:hypothetical protein DESC_870004 [Desulfosarcina cetonica]|nr:hypothetical protein DESC_870004 [Desulfosarcina cetonica]